jgi:hypothetical protein
MRMTDDLTVTPAITFGQQPSLNRPCTGSQYVSLRNATVMIGNDAIYFLDLEPARCAAIRDDKRDEHCDSDHGSNTPHHV